MTGSGVAVMTPAGPTQRALDLLARPDIAALVDAVRGLSPQQRRHLAQTCAENCDRHGRAQIRICYRTSKADPDNYPDHAAVRALVWEIAARPRDGLYAAAVAASDASFVLLAGDMLDPHERVLFDGPWRAVVGALIPTLAAVRTTTTGGVLGGMWRTVVRVPSPAGRVAA